MTSTPTLLADRALAASTHPIDESPWPALASTVSGRLITPGDDDWATATMPWLVNVEQRPAAVLECADAHDVAAAVRWAVDRDVKVTAQPVGHGAGPAFDNVLLLRTRALDGIEIDLEGRVARVEAGVKGGELLEALNGTGLTFLSGSSPDPSVVGMTITGGISWFSRAYGLGSESILAVDLIDGSGQHRRVSATENSELFWALRGGGGDFGIITRLELALHPAPQVYGGRLMWPIGQMREVLHAFRRVSESAPEELTTWFHVYRFPPLPEVPEPIRGKAFVGVAVAYLGGREDAEEHLAPFRDVEELAMDLLDVVPLRDLGSIAAEPADPMPAMTRSCLLNGLDDDAIAKLVATVGADSGSPLPVVQVRHLGGAFARVVSGAGVHGPVTEPYNLMALGVPAVPELVEVIELYFNRLGAAVAHLTSGRTLLNFLDGTEDAGAARGGWWSPEDRARLVGVKELADPLDTIRSNRPVRA